MKPRKICKKIVEQGNCGGIYCHECPLIDIPCYPPGVKAKQWLQDHPKKEKKEWDGSFVPGEFYQSFDKKIIVLCGNGEPFDSDCFYGCAILSISQLRIIGEVQLNDAWEKRKFKPCKINIEVIE